MTPTQTEFKIQAYSIKELRAWYKVSRVTWKKWVCKVENLGDYDGKKYTPDQVKKIVKHLGEPL